MTRQRCPFYGFAIAPGFRILMDTLGNQCALVTRAHSPCQMEISGTTPDWSRCALNNNNLAPAITKMQEEFTVYPEISAAEGVPFRTWFDLRTAPPAIAPGEQP